MWYNEVKKINERGKAMKAMQPARQFMLRCERKKWIVQAIKACLFWGITIALLVVSTKESDVLNPQVQPIWYYGLIIGLILLPIWYYDLYRIFTFGFYVGTVEECQDTEKRKLMEKVNPGESAVSMLRKMKKADCRVVIIKDDKGRLHKYNFKGRFDADYARKIFFVGKRAEYWLGAKYPVPVEMPLNRHFCFYCGLYAADEHEVCPDCGCPYPDEIKEIKNYTNTERN